MTGPGIAFRRLFPYRLRELSPFGQPGVILPGHADARGHIEVSPAIEGSGETAVILVAGQSTAANHAESRFTPTHSQVQMLNPYDGRLYVARDPMLGASCGPPPHDGSFITRMGDELIALGAFRRVIFVNVAIGSTSIGDWCGPFFHRLAAAYRWCRLLGWARDQRCRMAVLWCQGEQDGLMHTPAKRYAATFYAMHGELTHFGYRGPWFVARTTYAFDRTSETIRSAQAGLVDDITVFSAGDFDACAGAAHRWDTVHLSTRGASAVAAMAAARIARSLPAARQGPALA